MCSVVRTSAIDCLQIGMQSPYCFCGTFTLTSRFENLGLRNPTLTLALKNRAALSYWARMYNSAICCSNMSRLHTPACKTHLQHKSTQLLTLIYCRTSNREVKPEIFNIAPQKHLTSHTQYASVAIRQAQQFVPRQHTDKQWTFSWELLPLPSLLPCDTWPATN